MSQFEDHSPKAISRRAFVGALAATPFAFRWNAGLRQSDPNLGISPQGEREMKWLKDAKYGMFIHWGLYAGPGKGEWMMRNDGIDPEVYEKLATDKNHPDYFAADRYKPEEWAKLAKAAGMQWMCLTARHHDGFSLFRSPYPGSFCSWQTHQRDFVAEYVKACRSAGLKVGLYFSPINWRYPGYYDVYGTNCLPNSFGYKTDPVNKENARKMKEENYVNVRALMTNYGRIDHIFWDGGWLGERGSDADAAFFHEPGRYLDPANAWPIDAKYVEKDGSGKGLGIMGVTRKHQPRVLVNPRYGWVGDYRDEEGGSEVKGPIREVLCQKCMTTAGAWGYDHRAVTEGRVITPEQIVEMLVNCVVRNMVLLLNVGPDRHGVIPEPVAKSLREAGKWIDSASEAIYETRSGPWNPVDRKAGYCYRGNTVFVHLMKEMQESQWSLPPVESRVPVRAWNVLTGEKLTLRKDDRGVWTVAGIAEGALPNRVFAVQFRDAIGP